ncbi:MAG: hypothetical protein K0S47_4647 [Herbinix sp.]|jgi:hypothetical protein|nr:hypothetical protein [Herbinix sp.]
MQKKEEIIVTRSYGEEHFEKLIEKIIREQLKKLQMVTTKEW